MPNELLCDCGKPIAESLEGSAGTLLQGYIICKGCGERIAVNGTEILSETIDAKTDEVADQLRKFIKDI